MMTQMATQTAFRIVSYLQMHAAESHHVQGQSAYFTAELSQRECILPTWLLKSSEKTCSH